MLRKFGSVVALILPIVAFGYGLRSLLATPRLSYNGSIPFPAVVGEAIILTPAVSRPADQYRVSPSLPPGLAIDEVNGVIWGTPTAASRTATYVVSATDAGVRVRFPLVLSVTQPPRGLSYSSPLNATLGTALEPLSPTIAGPVEHYAISPSLPRGLVLDGTSGVLSGTPGEARKLAPYTITASSLAGNTRFVLLLGVTPAPPRARASPGTAPGGRAGPSASLVQKSS